MLMFVKAVFGERVCDKETSLPCHLSLALNQLYLYTWAIIGPARSTVNVQRRRTASKTQVFVCDNRQNVQMPECST